MVNRRHVFIVLLLAAVAAIYALWPRDGVRPEEESAAVAESPAQPQPTRTGAMPASARSASAASPEAPPQPADGHVEVRVTAAGKPHPARVRLYLRGPPNPSTQEIEWTLAGTADAGSDGVVRIPAKAGMYNVAASAPGLATARRDLTRPSGEKISRVLLELQAGTSLSGRTVAKDNKEPVPLATVTLTYDAGAPGQRFVLPPEEQVSVHSDARGVFRFDGLAPGRYRAEARATGYSRAVNPRFDVPHAGDLVLELGAASFIEGTVVTADGKPAGGAEVSAVGSDTVVGVATETGSFSLEVSPRSWKLSARRGDEAGAVDQPVAVAAGTTARNVRIQLGPAAGVSGTVVGGLTQKGIAGARVEISPHGHNGDSGSTLTDASGTFTVTPLAPGTYDVAVRAAGFSDLDHGGISLSAGQRFPLRLELHETGSVEGTVRDSAGHGVAFALVRGSDRRRGPMAGGDRAEARTDDAGNYRLFGLKPGGAFVSALRDGAGLGVGLPVDVPEGGVAHLDLTLLDDGVVQGTVRHPDGTPLTKTAMVNAFRMAMGSMSSDDMARAPVDASGAYRITLPVGTYNLRPIVQGARGGFRDRSIVSIEAGKTQTLDLTVDEKADDADHLEGLVLEPGGVPSAGAFVRAAGGPRGMGFASATTADENGKFFLPRDASAKATFEIFASNGGRTGRVTADPAQPNVTIQLQAAATVRGHVSGSPSSFHVDVSNPSMPGFGQIMMGDDLSLEFAGDRFELRDVPAAKVRIDVRTPNNRRGSAEVQLTPGGVAEVEIALVESASISGRLVDARTQQPLAGIFLMLDGHGFGSRDDGSTGGDGRFKVPTDAGEHELAAFAPRYTPFRKKLTLQTGQQLDLGDVAFEPVKAQPGTIGANVRVTPEALLVFMVIQDGPAEKAGVLAGDQIVAIDGAPVKGLKEPVRKLMGPPGSQVEVTITRNGQQRVIVVQRAS